MLLIVAHHYVVNSKLGGILQEAPLSERNIFFYLFGAWGKTGKLFRYDYRIFHVQITNYAPEILKIDF